MSKDQLALSRGGIAARSARSTSAPPSNVAGDEPTDMHPLSILAMASSIRLDDPRLEHERVVMLEIAIVAGREASRALDRWLSQSLAEYRGSRSAWDLEATTAELRGTLDRYDRTLRETAERLVGLIPDLSEKVPGFAPSIVPKRGRRRLLDEIAAASGLLAAIEPQLPVQQRQATTGVQR